MLFVVLALLPIFGLSLYDLYERRELSARAAQKQLVEFAQRAAVAQRDILDTTQQFLLSLAQYHSTETPTPIACSILFDEMLRRNRLYANLGLVDANGKLICAGVMPEQPLDLSTRPYFARLLQQQATTSPFEIGIIVGAPTVNLALPLVDDAQQIRGAVFASLNPTWLREFAEVYKIPPGSTLALVEHENAFAIRHPDFNVMPLEGLTTLPRPQLKALLNGQGTIELRDTDDTTRLYAFIPLSPEAYLGTGIPTRLVYAEIDQAAQRDALVLLLVALGALGLAWWYSERCLARPVRAMLHTAQRIQAGDLGARTGEVNCVNELTRLAHALNEMAATLQQRAVEQQNAAEALRQQAEELATITHLSQQVTAVADLNQVLTVIARTTATLAQTDASGVYLPDDTGALRLVAGHGINRSFIESMNAIGIRADEGALGRAISERRPIQIPDTHRDYAAPFADVVRAEGIRAILAVPLFRDTHLTGGIVLYHRQPRHFAPSEIAFLQAVAQQCVNAIENARLLQAEREARELAQALRDIAATLSSTLNFDEVLDRILMNIERVVPYDNATVLLVEGDVARLVRQRTRLPQSDWRVCEQLTVSTTPNLQRIMDTHRPDIIADTRVSPDWLDFPETRWIRSHISAPLRIKQHVIGFLGLNSATPNFFNQTHAQRLQAFADHAALALENARLLTRTEQRAQHLALLVATARDVAVQQNLSSLLETIVERARELVGTAHSALFLYDPARRELEFVLQKGYALDVPMGTRLQLGEGLAGRVAQTRQPMFINDYRHWENRAPQFAHLNLSAVLEVPLLYRGELLGVLTVAEVGAARRFTDEDVHLLMLFASQAAGAVHNTRVWQETQRRAEQLALLYDAGLALNSILEPRAQLEYLLKIACRTLRADRVTFLRYNPARDQLEPELCIGYDAETAARWQQLGAELPLAQWIAVQRLPLNLPDLSADSRYVPIDPSLRSGLWMPIEREQRLLGVLGVLSTRPHAFTPEAERLLALFANQAAVAIENTRLFNELQSSLQTLTRLYDWSNQILVAENVQQLAERTLEILRTMFSATVAFMHLFDAHGHLTFSYGVGIESLDQEWMPRPQGLARQVWQSGQPFFVNDPQLLPPSARARQLNAAVVVPLRDQPVNLGVLYLLYHTRPWFGGHESELLALFANQVALAIKRAQLFEEMQQRLRELEIVNEISSHLRTALNAHEILPAVLEATLRALAAQDGLAMLYDAEHSTPREIVARGEWTQPNQSPWLATAGMLEHVITTGETYIAREFSTDPLIRERAGTIPAGWGGVCAPIRTAQATIGVMLIAVQLPRVIQPTEARLVHTIATITGSALQRAELYTQAEQRVQRLNALRAIDMAMSASLDLRVTLNILLDHAIHQLDADAACVWIHDAQQHTLVYAAGQGFQHATTFPNLRPDEGYPATAVLEQRQVHHTNLAALSDPRAAMCQAEGFISYSAAPLMSQGHLQGVLEIFYRDSHSPSTETLEFLGMLARQAALAIELATSMNHLQRSNLELTLAYDSTIEGWSRLLDLRDQETEGHTQRVAALAVRLARAMGFTDKDLVNVRRGALLHDIGKMAIPDRILHKKSPLTREEMEEMQRHPQYAYEMLSSIDYLREALDIPYCHHEKWDGSGYPRGLKGEEIPLAARIFAVVDVWDALCSPRPYRQAWERAQVYEYMRAQAGKAFDPHIVQVFLQMMANDPEA